LSVSDLLSALDRVREAVREWQVTHRELLQLAESSHRGGWLYGSGGLEQFSPGALLPASLAKALCALETDQAEAFRLVGHINLPVEASGAVARAAAAREALDEASQPLRKAKRADLVRLPEASEVGANSFGLWHALRPSDSLWRPSAGCVGVPRIQIRYAVRPLLIEGSLPDVEAVSFSQTRQMIISRRKPADVRAQLELIVDEDGPHAMAARRDVMRLDALTALRPQPLLAYRYAGDTVYNLNFTWANGTRRKVKSSLPLFWCADQPICPQPLDVTRSTSCRKRRADMVYFEQPVLETLQVYSTMVSVCHLPDLASIQLGHI
jgi:hypothetical protein